MRPISGDPDFVAAQAQAILDAAGQIRDASKKLYRLGYGPVRSDAVDSLQVNVRELATVLDDSWTRYENTGEALAAYAPALRDCQQRVNAAISAMGHTDVHSAQAHLTQAEAHQLVVNNNPFASQHDRDEATLAVDHARTALYHQQSAASTAQTNYDSAIADLNAAAQAAANRIELGIEMSQLNDTFGDRWNSFVQHLHDALSKALKYVHELLQKITLVLTIISIVVIVIGFVTGQPEIIAAGLLAGLLLNRAVTVLSLIDLGVQELRFAIGDISFGELVGSAIIAGLQTLTGMKFDSLLFDNPVGSKFTASAIKFAADRGLNDSLKSLNIALNGESTLIGGELDAIGRIVEPHLDGFINSITGTPTDVSTMFGPSHDVGQLTPDFSHIDVNAIVPDNPVSISPMVAGHVSVGAAA
jgi:hypothetical protein